MRPRDGIASGIEAGGETIVPHGTIPAAGEIVFARPDDFHGSFGDFGDVHGFDDEIGRGIGAAAETAAEERGVDFDFFRGQAGDGGSVGAVDGFELRAGPDFATVRAEIDDAVEGLHHGVGEVGHVVFGGDGFRGACQSGGGVAGFFRDGSGSRGLLGEIGEQLRG